MSSTLIILASILALFAVILIPLMMIKPNQQLEVDQPHNQRNQGKKPKKKKR